MDEERTPLLIVGSDAEALTALDIALSNGVLVYGFITDDRKLLHQSLNDVPVAALLGSPDAQRLLESEGVEVLVAACASEDRRELLSRTRDHRQAFATLIHRTASVSEYAQIGPGSLVGAGSAIGPNVEIGPFASIGALVSMAPESRIGAHCTLQSGARIGREVQMADDVTVGYGAMIHDGVHLGAGATVAPGAVVLRDVEPETTVFGNPARPAKTD